MKICIYANEINSIEYREDGQNYITIETFKPSDIDEKNILIEGLMSIINFIEFNF